MTDNKRSIRELLILLLWTGSGVLSWYLSTYIFTYILSPSFIKLIREINAIPAASFIKNVANMFFVYASDFLLCFLSALALSLWTKSTKSRLASFILGAIVVRIFTQIDVLVSQIGHYSEIPAWAVTSLVQGLIPPVLIVPLFSISGSNVGRFIKVRKRSK